MTCEDCQAIIIDIARGADVDRASRDEARRHAALCVACGEQQQEQQWLTTQLRALAAEDSTRNAPARVEIAALAAYRAAYGVGVDSGARAQATEPAAVPAIPAVSASRRSWVIPSVVLAGLAAAAMAMMFVWPSAKPGSSKTNVATQNSSSTAGTPSSVARNKQGRGDGAPAATTVAAASAKEEEAPRPSHLTPAHSRVEAVLARATMRDAEFLPLPYAEPLRSTEARHIVRVSMTSGDEMILGMLPADRRSGQPFEADVLVGEDGIARAIRIVH
jgi:hypothetical protein